MFLRAGLCLMMVIAGVSPAVAKDVQGFIDVYTVKFLPSGGFAKDSIIGQFTFVYDDTPTSFDGASYYTRQSMRDLSGYLNSGEGRTYNSDLGGYISTWRSAIDAEPSVVSGLIGGNLNGLNTISAHTEDFFVTFFIAPPSTPRYSPDTYFTGFWSAPVVSEFTTSPINAVPEPLTWTTMVMGFGILAGALRRRRPSIATSAFRMNSEPPRVASRG